MFEGCSLGVSFRHLTPEKRPLHQFNGQLMELWGVQDLLRDLIRRADDFERECKSKNIVSELGTAIYCSDERSPPFAGMEPTVQESLSRGVGTSCKTAVSLRRAEHTTAASVRSPRPPPLCGAHDRRLCAEPKTAAYVRSQVSLLSRSNLEGCFCSIWEINAQIWGASETPTYSDSIGCLS